jgi:hypothetical protein
MSGDRYVAVCTIRLLFASMVLQAASALRVYFAFPLLLRSKTQNYLQVEHCRLLQTFTVLAFKMGGRGRCRKVNLREAVFEGERRRSSLSVPPYGGVGFYEHSFQSIKGTNS